MKKIENAASVARRLRTRSGLPIFIVAVFLLPFLIVAVQVGVRSNPEQAFGGNARWKINADSSASFQVRPWQLRPVQFTGTPEPGTFLVATRGLRDPNFSQTVVLLIDYDSAGAFGLIIDRPSGHSMTELWPEIAGLEAHSVFFGGPVLPHRLLFLLRSDSARDGTRRVFRGVYLGSDELVLKRILAEGEDEFRVYAGHAGWAGGQLDNEIARGDWYILPAERAFIFHQEPFRIWEELIQRVDIQVVNLRK